MNPYLKITGRTFTIWLLACLINGLLCGVYFSVCQDIYFGAAESILLAFILSLFFSTPGFFVFWIVLLLKISTYTTQRALFRSALITGFILALTTAIFCVKLISSEFDNYLLIPASIVLSTLSSIMLHFRYFKKINRQ